MKILNNQKYYTIPETSELIGMKSTRLRYLTTTRQELAVGVKMGSLTLFPESVIQSLKETVEALEREKKGREDNNSLEKGEENY